MEAIFRMSDYMSMRNQERNRIKRIAEREGWFIIEEMDDYIIFLDRFMDEHKINIQPFKPAIFPTL
jgi:hypothetical protein